MLFSSLRHCTVAAVVLAASLTAQSSVVRGELADGRATGCYYCPGYQYVIKFVGTQLASPTVNLNLLQNQMVEFTGNWNGSVFTVTAAQVVAQSFSITGNPSLGRRVRCNAQGTPGDVAINAIGVGTGFVVPFGTMTVLLDPATATVMGVGVVNGAGEFKSDLDIPAVPALVGVRVTGQAFFAPLTAPMFSSNVDTTVILP